MKSITIEMAGGPGEYIVKADDKLVGHISRNYLHGGYDVTSTFGDELPEGIGDQVTITVPAYSLAIRVATALASVGRGSGFGDIRELADQTCYVMNVHTGNEETALSGYMPNPETAEYISRILIPVVNAVEGPARHRATESAGQSAKLTGI